MSVRRTVVRNTAFNAAGRLWEAITNLFLTAYVVPRVGLAAWGLWALIGVFTSYVSLLDFGLGSGFSKYIAEHAARGERERLSAVVSTGFYFYLVLGVVLVAIGWPCVDYLIAGVAALLDWLNPVRAQTLSDSTTAGDVRFLLRGGLVLFAASNCIAAFTAVQTGLQRMGITNIVSFAASLVKVVATVGFVATGYGVRGLLFANLVVFAFFGVSCIVIAFRLIPGLRLTPASVRRDTLGLLFSYGWRTQVSKLSNLLTFQTDKVLIGVVYKQFGLIGLYRIGEELANKMRQAPALMLSAVIPAASQLDAHGDAERLRLLYLRSSKYVSVVSLPMVAFLVATAGPVVRAWIGPVPDLNVAVWVTRIITVGYLANIIPGAGVSIALGMGRPEVQMKAGIIAMVSNLVFTISLVLTIGFYGVPLGTAISMVLSCIWFVEAMKSIVGVGSRELVRVSLLWPTAAALPGIVVCIACDFLSSGIDGRWTNAAVMVGCAVFFGLVYAVVLRLTPFLDAYDVEFLCDLVKADRLPGGRRLIGHLLRAGYKGT